MKTSIEILKGYGTIRFARVGAGDQSEWHVAWYAEQWSKEAYGLTKEAAASGIVSGLHYIVLHKVHQVEAGYEN